MFSVATPPMSVAACPPAPMAAMFSFSLGEMVRTFELAAGAAWLELHVSINPEAAAVEVKMKWRREWRRDEEVMGAISRLAPCGVKAIGDRRRLCTAAESEAPRRFRVADEPWDYLCQLLPRSSSSLSVAGMVLGNHRGYGIAPPLSA